MSNLTPVVNGLLAKSGSKAVGERGYPFERINEFLKEAYQINTRINDLLTYLRSIRRPYLSNVPPLRRRHLQIQQQDFSTAQQHLTDQQRDQIDAEAKAVLRDLHAAVSNLSRTEQVRQEAESVIASQRRKRKGFGALGQWAAGGGVSTKSPEQELEAAKANGIRVHRDGVIWFLQRRLEQCGEVQTLMMQTRLDREIEKSKSVLHKARGADPVPVWEESEEKEGPVKVKGKGGSWNQFGVRMQGYDDDAGQSQSQVQVNDEQMQVLARENEDMLKQYENKLDQVRAAEKSLVEISELQTTLASNLEIQTIHINQLVQDSYLTTGNVGSGNKELKRASERKSTAKFVFFATVGVCSFFVVWDLII